MAYCTKCDSYKPLEDFGDYKDGLNGKNPRCRQCVKDSRQQGRVKKALYMKHFNYGIPVQEYLSLLEAQRGVCAICGNPETKIHKGLPVLLSVDHNHETGKVRGLLCFGCNRGLGSFRDDRDLLRKAVDYLFSTDEDRTQNPRPTKIASTGEIDKKIDELTREVKGLPKQLRDDATHTDLPLFTGLSV